MIDPLVVKHSLLRGSPIFSRKKTPLQMGESVCYGKMWDDYRKYSFHPSRKRFQLVPAEVFSPNRGPHIRDWGSPVGPFENLH